MLDISNQIKNKTKTVKRTVEKETDKLQLLLEQPKDSFQELRQKLGWDNEKRKAEKEMGELLESKKFFQDNGNDILFTDDLANILIDNNYFVTSLNNYNGKITDDLLSILDKHFKKDKSQAASPFNKSNILIIHPYKTKYQEHAKKTEELIVIEKISDRRYNNKSAFKIIGRTGRPNVFVNKLRALIFTHTRQTNSIRNTLAFSAGFLLLWIIKNIRCFFEDGDKLLNIVFGDYAVTGSAFYIMLLALFLKFFIVSIIGDIKNDPSLNVFDDKGYRKLSERSRELVNEYTFNRNIVDNVTLPYYMGGKIINTIKRYNRATKIILIGLFILFTYCLTKLPKALYLYADKGTVVVDDIRYEHSTPFTYKTTYLEK